MLITILNWILQLPSLYHLSYPLLSHYYSLNYTDLYYQSSVTLQTSLRNSILNIFWILTSIRITFSSFFVLPFGYLSKYCILKCYLYLSYAFEFQLLSWLSSAHSPISCKCADALQIQFAIHYLKVLSHVFIVAHWMVLPSTYQLRNTENTLYLSFLSPLLSTLWILAQHFQSYPR